MDVPAGWPELSPAVHGTYRLPPEALQRYVNGQPAIGSLEFRLGYGED